MEVLSKYIEVKQYNSSDIVESDAQICVILEVRVLSVHPFEVSEALVSPASRADDREVKSGSSMVQAPKILDIFS